MESSSNSIPAQPSPYRMSHLLRSLTIPRKLSSLPNSSLLLSTSLPVRAPLTLDDDDDDDDEEEEENDTEIESNDNHSESSSVISTITASDGEPDEGELAARIASSNINGESDKNIFSLKPFVRPIAKLNWDSDSSDDDNKRSDSEVDSRGGFDFSSVVVSSVVGKVSVAPRVGVFKFDDNDDEEEEGDFDGCFGSLEGREEPDLTEESSKVEIEECSDLVIHEEEKEKEGFEGCEEESDLVARENDSAEKSSEGEIEECLSVGLLEGREEKEGQGFDGGFGNLSEVCEEVSNLAVRGKDLFEKSTMEAIEECREEENGGFGGLKGCEEESDLAEKSSKAEIEESSEELNNFVSIEEEGFDGGESDLLASQNGSTEKSVGFLESDMAASEAKKIDECSVGLLEGCEKEFNNLDPSDGEREELKGFKEEPDSAACEKDAPEKSSDAKIEKCSLEAPETKLELKIEEDNVFVDEVSSGVCEGFDLVVTEKKLKLDSLAAENQKCLEIDWGFDKTETEEHGVLVSETSDDVICNLEKKVDSEVIEEASFDLNHSVSNRDHDLNVKELTVRRSSEEDEEIANEKIEEIQQSSRVKLSVEDFCSVETNPDLSLKILVLGRSGVGKSSTTNLILGENKALVNAFEPSTISAEEITGTVNGSEIRILDTPGLRSDWRFNQKILNSVRRRLKRFSPDIVLYIDRSDVWDDENHPIVSLITSSLGPSIWEKAAIVLSHSSSSSEISVDQKFRAIERSIGESLRNPNLNLRGRVSLVENHQTANEDLNGRSELLLLCYSMKKRLDGEKKNEVSCVPRNHTNPVFSRFGARLSTIVGLAMALQIAISGLMEK